MKYSIRSLSMAVAFASAYAAIAAPTLTITNSASYNASSAQAQVTALTPVLAAPPGAASTFKTAFDAWNASGGGQGWTLVTGGTLGADTIFNITQYTAYCSGLTGGVEITMTYTPGVGAPTPATQANVGAATTAFWTQSIVTNAPLGNNTSPYLDISGDAANNGGSTFNPPLYPYQYTGSQFYDKPARTVVPNGPTINWTATAYICTRNTATSTLTVYDGVTWGFSITPVPEPTSLAALGLGGIAILRRRRSR